MNWDALTASRIDSMDVRDFPSTTPVAGLISFSGGSPASELFPIESFAQAYGDAIREEGLQGLQYGPAEGVLALRQDIATLMAGRDVQVDPADVLVVNGALQGLDMVCRALLDQGDPIVLDAPTFVGALTTFRAYQPEIHLVPVDDGGMDVAILAERLANGLRPKFIYALPTFHNPAGVTMSTERRQRLLDLSIEYGVPILEDDPYGDLWFQEQAPTPIRGMAGGEDVLFVSTFSKILAPGLRLGWIVRPKAMARAFSLAKRGADLSTDQMLQRAVHRWLAMTDTQAHLQTLRDAYRARGERMLQALKATMPAEVRWTEPDGGFFVWLTLPEGTDASAMLAAATQAGVSYVPGAGFHADASGRHTLRLAFSQATFEQIDEGIRRLAGVLGKHLEEAEAQPERIPIQRQR